MNITIDQAIALDAVARQGTVQGAAAELNKGHSAILYLLRSLEQQTEIKIFDRSGYRNQLTTQGRVVLKYCRKLIETRDELKTICQRFKGKWEPSIDLVYDGVVDCSLIFKALAKLRRSDLPTEIRVHAAFLDEVEQKFTQQRSDVMVTVLPIRVAGMPFVELKPIEMLLVAQRGHELVSARSRTKLSAEDLEEHTFIKVRHATAELGLETEGRTFKSVFMVNDFSSKKAAIQQGLGFGWLPGYLVQKEIASGDLSLLKYSGDNRTLLRPRLYHRKPEQMGRTTQELVKLLL